MKMENIIFCDVANKMTNRKPLNMIRYYVRDYIRLDIRDFCFTEQRSESPIHAIEKYLSLVFDLNH